MHEEARSGSPCVQTSMSLTEGWPHAVCSQVESLLTCQNYITSMASGKLRLMKETEGEVALPLSERLPNEKKKKCCIILSYTYDMDHSRHGSAICWMGPILSFWNCSFSVHAFSWSCLCIWLSSTSVLLIYLRNTYCQQIKRDMLMGAVCWASSASYQSLS